MVEGQVMSKPSNVPEDIQRAFDKYWQSICRNYNGQQKHLMQNALFSAFEEGFHHGRRYEQDLQRFDKKCFALDAKIIN